MAESRGIAARRLARPAAASRVPSGYRRVQKDAPRRGWLRAHRLPACAGTFARKPASRSRPSCHGKEGVAGSSPAEGFRNRAVARFLVYGADWTTTSGRQAEVVAGWEGQKAPRHGAAGWRRLAVARSHRSSSPVSARVPSGQHSVANRLVRLSDRCRQRRGGVERRARARRAAGPSTTFGAAHGMTAASWSADERPAAAG
jgi:hypothetical protein